MIISKKKIYFALSDIAIVWIAIQIIIYDIVVVVIVLRWNFSKLLPCIWYDISQWVKIRLREVLHCLAQFFLKNFFNGAALMRQVCGVEKTLINAANVVAQTSIFCTFSPVFSPYVILWHFTFEKPLHPKYFFMIRKNIIYPYGSTQQY